MVSVGFESFVWKSLLAIAIGGLIGLEREKREHHIIGFRTFALTGFLGMLLTSMTHNPYAVALGLAGVFALAALYYVQRARHTGAWGVTTTIMLPTTYVLGALAGAEFFVEAALAAVIAVFLLVEQHEVHHITQRVSKNEIIDLLLFAIIAFVVYPQLPEKPIELLGEQLNLRFFWTIVVSITTISFGGFILTKYVGKQALSLAAFFGGFVSSVAVVAVMAEKAKSHARTVFSVLASASAGSIASDIILLAVVSPAMLGATLPTIAAFLAAFTAASWLYSKNAKNFELQQSKRPLSLKFITEFSLALFLVSWIITWTAENAPSGMVLSSFIGGLLSSTSVFASLALLYNAGLVNTQTAALCLFAALAASLSAKTFISGIATKKWAQAAKTSAVLLAAGAAGLAVNLYW
ncbi:MAG: DUF4010 domain-containing protein [Candidatus Norongarragalinales archaeon]